MWKAQLKSVDNQQLIVRFYHEDGREHDQAYDYTGSETIPQLRAPIIDKVAQLNAQETAKAAMATKLSAYVGKDIA